MADLLDGIRDHVLITQYVEGEAIQGPAYAANWYSFHEAVTSLSRLGPIKLQHLPEEVRVALRTINDSVATVEDYFIRVAREQSEAA